MPRRKSTSQLLQTMGQIRDRHCMWTAEQRLHNSTVCRQAGSVDKTGDDAVKQFVWIGLWEISNHGVAWVPEHSKTGLMRPVSRKASWADVPFAMPALATWTKRHFDGLFSFRQRRGLMGGPIGGGGSV